MIIQAKVISLYDGIKKLVDLNSGKIGQLIQVRYAPSQIHLFLMNIMY